MRISPVATLILAKLAEATTLLQMREAEKALLEFLRSHQTAMPDWDAYPVGTQRWLQGHR